MISFIMTIVLVFTNIRFITFAFGKKNEWDPLKTDRDWVSSEIIFDAKFLDVINEFKTVETVDDKGPIVLDDTDKSVLKKRCKADLICIKKKSLSIKKYKIKIEALQCIHAVIMHFILNIATSFHSSNEIKDLNFYIYPKVVMSRMLSVLYMSKTLAHNWLWIIYIQIHSNSSWPYMFIPGNNLFYLQHERQLLDYLNLCQANKYLPINNYAPFSPKAFYDAIVKMDIIQYIEQLYGYQYNVKLRDFFIDTVFEIDNFVLSDFFNRDTDLFGPFLKGKTLWGSHKKLLRSEKDTLRAVYCTLEWIKEPFKYIEYHKRVLRVVKINTYFYAWSHMKLFESTLSQTKNHIEKINFKVENTYIWRSPCKAIRLVMQWFHDQGDQVLFSITDNLCFDINEFNEEFLKKLRYMTKTVKEIILKDLKEISADDNDIGDTFDVDDKPESKEDLCQSLIHLGVNKNHVRDILYGNLNTIIETQPDIEEGSLIVPFDSSEQKHKELLSFENEKVILDVSIITKSKNTVTFKNNKTVERANRFLKYTSNLCVKLKPVNVYFIIFFYNGKEKFNKTFYPNTGVNL